MAKVFDGKKFAFQKEIFLKKKVKRKKEKGITPKLVSIMVGDDPGSKLYLTLKKKLAERIGASLQILNFSKGTSIIRIIEAIERFNRDKKVHGVMLQLPLPTQFSVSDRDKIIKAIDPKKDVDGMADNSLFVAPVVRAVLEIIKQSQLTNYGSFKTAVVGAKGFVGKKIIWKLRNSGFAVKGYDVDTKNLGEKTKRADILISAAGVPNLIKADMVKKGAVVIDVGAPKGDIKTASVKKKASFISPVPGGVGPVTVVLLLENLFFASNSLEN